MQNLTQIHGARRRVLSVLLTAAMLFTMLPAMTMPAQAAQDPFTALGFDMSTPDGQAEREQHEPLGKSDVFFETNELLITGYETGDYKASKLYLHGAPVTTTLTASSSPSVTYSTALDLGAGENLYTTGGTRQVALDWNGDGKKNEVAMFSVTNTKYHISVFDAATGSKAADDFTWELSTAPFYGFVMARDNVLNITAGDINGDGKDEIIVAYCAGTNAYGYAPDVTIRAFGNSGSAISGGEAQLLYSAGERATLMSLSCGDLDNDGIDDIALAAQTYGMSAKLYAAYGVRGGTMTSILAGIAEKTVSLATDGKDGTEIIAPGIDIVDVDGDGRKELLLGAIEGIKVTYETNGHGFFTNTANDGSESFRDAKRVIMAYKPNAEGGLSVQYDTRIAIPDSDLPRVDLLSAANVTAVLFDGSNTTPYVFVNKSIYGFAGGEWTMRAEIPFSTPAEKINLGWDATAADLNGDGKEDLIFKTVYDYNRTAVVILYDVNVPSNRVIMKYENFSTYTSPLSFSLPNTDNDSVVARIKEYQLLYTDPSIVAALASAPYYTDLRHLDLGSDYLADSKTSFKKSTSSGSGGIQTSEVSSGVYFGFEQDFEVFGITVASIEMGMEIGNTIANTVETNVTYSTSVEYSTEAGQDSVVLYSIPMDYFLYEFTIPTNAEGTEFITTDAACFVPYTPIVSILPLYRYNEVAAANPDLPNIAEDVFTHTLGDAMTYPKSAYPNDLAQKGGNIVNGSIITPSQFVGTGFGSSSITQTLSMENSTETQHIATTDFNFKVGGGAGGITVGYYNNQSQGSGHSTVNTAGLEYSGSVHALNNEVWGLGYDFNWKLAQYIYNADSGQFPVVTYIVDGAVRPPLLPTFESMRASEVTSNSVKLVWDASADVRATDYEVYVLMNNAYIPMGSVAALAGQKSYSYLCEGLADNQAYDFVLRVKGGGQKATSVYGPPLKVYTMPTGVGGAAFPGLHDETVTEEVLSVTFIPEITISGTQPLLRIYQWQKKNDEDTFVDLQGKTAANLIVDHPYQNLGEYRLRCTFYYSSGNWIVYSPSVFIKEAAETPNAPALTGTATIDNTAPKIDDTLTGALESGNNTGTLTYTWKAGGTAVGTDSATYIVQTADLDKAITLEITSSVETGTITSAPTAAIVKKFAPAAPAAPTLASKTHDSVTLTANTAYEFSTDGATWQSSNEFTGLDANTVYNFYQRLAETASTEASAASSALSVTTDLASASVTGVTVNPSTIEVQQGGTQQFGAEVVGTNNPAQTVTWTVEDANSASTQITSGGSLTVGADEPEGTLTVRATSTANAAIFGTATVTVTAAPPTPVYGISLDASGTYSFPVATEGYGAQTAKTVTITNIGNQATDTLSIGLSGTNADAFELSAATINDIAVNATDTFTVEPATGLTEGTYTATVEVSGGNGITAQSFNVSFTVNPSGGGDPQPVTYALTVNDGAGSGSYAAGMQVAITADPAPVGKVFDQWTATDGGAFANANSAATTYTMPDHSAAVTATYKDAPASGSSNNDGNDYSSGNSSTNTSGGGGGSSVIAPTLTIPAANGAVAVTYTQSGDTLTLTLPDSKITEIIGKSTATALIDASGITIAASVATTNGVTTVTLPKNALSQFADAGLTLEIQLPGGTITLTPEAATALIAATGGVTAIGGEIITLSLTSEETDDEDALTTIDTAPNDVPLSQAPLQREITKSDLTYIYGQNRVLTAIAISKLGWSNANTVILAPGAEANLIDALAVAPLAYQENAPILISVDDDIDTAILAEIQRLGATKIIAVGALSDSLIDQLRTIFPNSEIETLRGADRFATAALINAKITNLQGTIVVGYNAIADAVSIASWAAANAYAIHIANPDGTATPPSYGSGTNYILGGLTLVQDLPGYTRIYGADRYATNQLLRETLSFSTEAIYTADGNTLVDALTGSVLAAKTRSAIVLTPNNDPTGADFGDITPETKVYGFGGAK